MSVIDPKEEDAPIQPHERGKYTMIGGKRVEWSRIHEATGRNRKNVDASRFVHKKGFDGMSSLLQGSLKKHGLTERIGKSMGPDLFRAAVKERLPIEMHEKFRPLHIVHGVLTVACLSSGVAFSIRKHERDIMASLEEAGSGIESLKTILSTWR